MRATDAVVEGKAWRPPASVDQKNARPTTLVPGGGNGVNVAVRGSTATTTTAKRVPTRRPRSRLPTPGPRADAPTNPSSDRSLAATPIDNYPPPSPRTREPYRVIGSSTSYLFLPPRPPTGHFPEFFIRRRPCKCACTYDSASCFCYCLRSTIAFSVPIRAVDLVPLTLACCDSRDARVFSNFPFARHRRHSSRRTTTQPLRLRRWLKRLTDSVCRCLSFTVTHSQSSWTEPNEVSLWFTVLCNV